MQVAGCRTLLVLCQHGTDAVGLACKQRAVVAGGRGAAAAAMEAHPGIAEVQRLGQRVTTLLSG